MTINISKRIHIKQETELEEATVRSIVALASDASKQILLQSIALGQQRDFYFRVTPNAKATYTQPDYVTQQSKDGGATWQTLEALPITEQAQDGKHLLWDAPYFNAHPTCPNTVARLRAVCDDLPGVLPWDPISPRKYSGRIFCEISNDAGQSWGPMRQMICDGGDAIDWSPLTRFGINSGRVVAGSQALYLDENQFAVPFVAAHHDQSKFNPQQHTSSLLFGNWEQDKTQINWDMGGSVTLPEHWSVDGGDEPSVEKLNDGRLIYSCVRVRLKMLPR